MGRKIHVRSSVAMQVGAAVRSSFLGAIAIFIVLSVGMAESARSQTDDTIQAIKDSLSGGQGSNSILQDVLGKGQSKKSDSKFKTPETVQSKTDRADLIDKLNKAKELKTQDGRVLRQRDEDPELRPDDTILIDLSPLEEICSHYGNGWGS